tara:strand:+ start:79 stop:303 length:225 start_codon:yes stop_codon:yes gene_type:complete
LERTLRISIQFLGEVESRGNKKHASLLADSLSLLLKITNGDNMKNNKKLRKALEELDALIAEVNTLRKDNEVKR